ncbi:hypothetical protein AGLY_009851 [Aphis glycines]|uniref:Uncharacterized protein n=1 Tax=Aphis glycines TaxID=307491 RepID=A0A6G0TH71_APHGL|nr:hypothetical protein AGLY_009851 [Aphis glycines]
MYNYFLSSGRGRSFLFNAFITDSLNKKITIKKYINCAINNDELRKILKCVWEISILLYVIALLWVKSFTIYCLPIVIYKIGTCRLRSLCDHFMFVCNDRRAENNTTNVNVISENGDNTTLSLSSAAVSITGPLMKPEDEQAKEVSADSEILPTIKRPYGSIPNISAPITNGGDTAAIEAPAAVAIQQVSAKPLEHCPGSIELANYVGPEMRYYVGLVNAEVMVPPAAAGEVESRSQSVSSDPPVSAAEHDGSGESDAKMNRGFVGRPSRLWCVSYTTFSRLLYGKRER